jgi:hypothetical protein
MADDKTRIISIRFLQLSIRIHLLGNPGSIVTQPGMILVEYWTIFEENLLILFITGGE